MKAIQIHLTGGPEVLQLNEVDEPSIKDGEALIQVEAAGVNFIDLYHRSGVYTVALPSLIGREGAGVVKDPGATGLKLGNRVAWNDHLGSYAEYAAIPASKLALVPDQVDAQSAAAVMLQGLTAQYLCEATFPVKAGNQVLVHAGAGGIGLLLIQMLRKKGAKIFTTVSTAEKAALAKSAGADETILYTKADFVQAIRDSTAGRGVDVVYDSVGQSTYEGSLNVLRRRGMLVLFGQSSGKVPPIDPLLLSSKGSLFLTRPTLNDYQQGPNEFQTNAAKVLGSVADGSLKVRIEKIYSLAEVAEAHQDLASRKTTGKLVIAIR